MAGARVEYYIHGRGRGHASRSAPIVRRLLKAGHRVGVYGGGDGVAMLQDCPEKFDRLPLLPGPLALPRLMARAHADRRDMQARRPDIVVSDGDQAALLAACMLRIPTLAIGHDLVFSCCELPAELDRRALLAQRANAAIPTYLAQRRIAVHFLPVRLQRRHTVLARPDSVGLSATQTRDEGYLLAYFRDGNGGRIVGALRGLGQQVHWFGPGARDGRGRPVPELGRESFRDELTRCSAVVASAGSNLLAECVLLGKPILALHRVADSEQALNAAWAAAARVAMAARFEDGEQAALQCFLARLAARDFSVTPLVQALRPVSDVAESSVSELLALRMRR